MGAEATQQQGRDGADFAKRWLESTTYLELPFSAYYTEPACSVDLLNGSHKVMDLAGGLLKPPFGQVYVEVKNYTQSSGLTSAFEEFLAVAYSASAVRAKKYSGNTSADFMFVTRHPFGAMTDWSDKVSVATLKAATEKHSHLLAENAFDPDFAAEVVQGIWLLVYHEKQGELTLSRSEVDTVMGILKRKSQGVS